jgi:outer membrane protein insertion porin family
MQYEQWYLSAGFSTGYRWLTFLGNVSLSGGLRVGFIRNNYDNTLYRPFDPAIREENNTWTMKNSVWASLTLDQRDIFYDPSNGYYLSDRFGVYGIFNNERERYFRNDTKAEYYLTLFNIPVSDNWSFKSIFAIHAGLSFIFKQPRDAALSATPIEDANKLAVDGMFIGRGWNNEYRMKGLLLTENWAELRFPLLPGILAFDFFFDAAGIEPSQSQGTYFKNFTWDCMRFSYGGGLRCTLPQFPIRFSLAKRFRFVDGEFKWEKGSVFAGDTDASGLDIVFSFAMSY